MDEAVQIAVGAAFLGIAVVICGIVFRESFERFRSHRHDYPSILLPLEQTRRMQELRYGAYRTKRGLLEDAEARILGGTEDKGAVVARLDRDLARVDAELAIGGEEVESETAAGLDRAARLRSLAVWLDAAFMLGCVVLVLLAAVAAALLV
ncbi:hypothetical protein [Streptomonospora litoralis]|uniref:Uncharacterized protein n=1 Tax=Streptomonospora litoralis TaxID=2498135 RepID=A0A4P6Q7H4_9ACTN|nr:hypothetical protein [Streptomonospora litoralis]QBI56330.1 hypothetical protein EKD16_22885 [Streptomonospora litoralis]